MIQMSDMTLSVETSDVVLTSIEDDREELNMEVKDIEKIPESLIKNKFSAPIATDDSKTTLLTTDDGYAILADWKYKEV